MGDEAGAIAVRVGAETETGRGWSYEVSALLADGTATTHVVTLSWTDHDEISGGAVGPSRVVEAVMEVVCEKLGEAPARFDVSTARRLVTGLSELARDRL